MTTILGINAYHGDAAAAIVRDGELIAAVEEERFNRIKHCAGFPTQSIQYCLRAAGVRIEEVDHIGISRDPSAHLHKKILFAARRLSLRGTEARRAEGKSQEAGVRSPEPVFVSFAIPPHKGGCGEMKGAVARSASRIAKGRTARPPGFISHLLPIGTIPCRRA